MSGWGEVFLIIGRRPGMMVASLQKKTVLVVDDEMDMRIFLSRLLESGGYQTITASNGVDGLKKVARERPDVIVLDVMINSEGGLDMFDDLKLDEQYKTIPVILLSTIDQKTLFQLRTIASPSKPLFAGRPDGFLIKPPEADDLINLLDSLIEPKQKEFGRTTRREET